MIAFVRSVIAASAASRSIRPVTGSQSTSTGVAPACSTALADATKVIDGTITSSPGPTPSARIPRMSAAVQEAVHRTDDTPMYSSSIRSNRCTFGPVPIQPDRRQSTTSAISSSPITGLPKTRKSSRGAMRPFPFATSTKARTRRIYANFRRGRGGPSVLAGLVRGAVVLA